MQNNIEKVQKYRKFYLHKFYDNDPFFFYYYFGGSEHYFDKRPIMTKEQYHC